MKEMLKSWIFWKPVVGHLLFWTAYITFIVLAPTKVVLWCLGSVFVAFAVFTIFLTGVIAYKKKQ